MPRLRCVTAVRLALLRETLTANVSWQPASPRSQQLLAANNSSQPTTPRSQQLLAAYAVHGSRRKRPVTHSSSRAETRETGNKNLASEYNIAAPPVSLPYTCSLRRHSSRCPSPGTLSPTKLLPLRSVPPLLHTGKLLLPAHPNTSPCLHRFTSPLPGTTDTRTATA